MGRKRQGKWWVQKDQLCTDVEENSPIRCYDVLLSGKMSSYGERALCRSTLCSGRRQIAGKLSAESQNRLA